MHREGDPFESGILHKIKNTQTDTDFCLGIFFSRHPMFYIYIIYSKTLDKYYIGSCQDIERRLQDHLNGRSTFTKTAKDWELKYFETFLTRSEACRRELQIKKMKSRKYIENLIITKRLEYPDASGG
ncbi:putative endonuclease [Flavobacterium sp. HSC-32F16]|nr:putative endonuclease [Flavobacterium sp. HSC-32F16]